MKTNGNNLAFTDYVTYSDKDEYVGGGLTKREFFAAMAMLGILAKQGVMIDSSIRFQMRDAVKAAKTLIVILNEESSNG